MLLTLGRRRHRTRVQDSGAFLEYGDTESGLRGCWARTQPVWRSSAARAGEDAAQPPRRPLECQRISERCHLAQREYAVLVRNRVRAQLLGRELRQLVALPSDTHRGALLGQVDVVAIPAELPGDDDADQAGMAAGDRHRHGRATER